MLNSHSKYLTALRVSDITSVYTVFSSKGVIKTRPDSYNWIKLYHNDYSGLTNSAHTHSLWHHSHKTLLLLVQHSSSLLSTLDGSYMTLFWQEMYLRAVKCTAINIMYIHVYMYETDLFVHAWLPFHHQAMCTVIIYTHPVVDNLPIKLLIA